MTAGTTRRRVRIAAQSLGRHDPDPGTGSEQADDGGTVEHVALPRSPVRQPSGFGGGPVGPPTLLADGRILARVETRCRDVVFVDDLVLREVGERWLIDDAFEVVGEGE